MRTPESILDNGIYNGITQSWQEYQTLFELKRKKLNCHQVDFAVPADYRLKKGKKRKGLTYTSLLLEDWKSQGDRYTTSSWWAENGTQGLRK